MTEPGEPVVVDNSAPRDWVDNAIRLIEADAQRSADTHLLRYPLPADWGIQLYLKVVAQLHFPHINAAFILEIYLLSSCSRVGFLCDPLRLFGGDPDLGGNDLIGLTLPIDGG